MRLAGHLGWYDPQKRSRLEIHLGQPVTLVALLHELEIPVAEIAVATVNRKAVDLEHARVSDADTVELFPPVGGG